MPGGPIAVGGGIGANAPKSKLAGILMTSFAAVGGVLFGYDTGTISGLQQMPNWLRTFGHPVPVSSTFPDGYGISSSQRSLIVSILSAGTFFGALSAAPIADSIGRKWGLVVACLVFSLGVVLQTAATALPPFITGRAFAGLGVGMVSTMVPMYQSECSPKWIRGAIVGLYQWGVTVGLLLAAVFNNITKTDLIIPHIAFPSSPRWLIKNRRDADAAQALSRLTSLPVGDPEVVFEIEEIRLNLKHEEELGESSYIDCFRSTDNRIRFRTLTGIFIQAWQQLTGINFIFYFGTTFFTNAGIRDPFSSQLSLPLSMSARRSPASGVSNVLDVVIYFLSVPNRSAQSALVAFVCFYIAFFASTWGPIGWIIIGEIFPLKMRAKGVSLSAASNWLFNWALAFSTPYMVGTGPGNANMGTKVFYIWGSMCFCCIIFAYFCVPETKGLSLEQIDLLYQNVAPVNSVSYRKRLLAEGTELSQSKGAAPATTGKDDDLDSSEKV
ncbi:hypothetical protein BGY98DRAFT_1173228 [Russula aff. rugulosa BPL654]|nr:hypothetical protein BGY98DRAFT_1173228 [Russula aff. rugulosa BPL654]